MSFFTDREGVSLKPTEEICNRVWKGIAAVIQQFIDNDCLSKDFPEQCPAGKGICGFNQESFSSIISGVIPLMRFPFPDFNYKEYDPFSDELQKKQSEKDVQYAILDTIEFVYSHLYDVIKDPKRYHTWYSHYELSFTDDGKSKEAFRNSINQLFERNGIVFRLEENGQISRQILPSYEAETKTVTSIKDDTLKGLITVALNKYKSPKFDERVLGLERLWDAFERIKTIYRSDLDKSDSSDRLIEASSYGNKAFSEKLKEESLALTRIGNQFQIRHHEVGKIPINNSDILDYLFLRLYSLIMLFLKVLPKE